MSAGEDERQLQIVSSRATPTIASVTVYRTKESKRVTVGELTQLDQKLLLPDDGPFEVYVTPKAGLPIKVVDKLIVKSGKTAELKLGELIGSVEVVGDNFPRADRIVLTDERDPGPGEKGHVAVQVTMEYRTEMAAPPGFYAVWIVPASGARAQRIVDRVRVIASKSVRVGEP
jgi:hypothetical protein